jgi:diguanylate cyclase (GGDEF)-like protein
MGGSGEKLDLQSSFATRVTGAMLLAGAVLGAIAVALPPRAGGSDVIVLILSGTTAALGLILFRSRVVLPEWLFGFALAVGTVLITLATHEGGLETGTDDNEMLYVWICLLAFNFLSLRHALLQLAVIGGAYATLLTQVPTGEGATRWLVSMTTLLVAGLVVHRLRSSRERLVAELTEQTRSDSLTGLLNRAALEDRAALELARARREKTPLSMIVLDVDGFKAFNDSLGHPAGDELLRAIAKDMSVQTRQVDALARLGGDEFGVLLPGASSNDARIVADRLRDAARTEDGGWATVSLGVAEANGRGNFEDLWHEADMAMYAAKRAGGDTVRCSEQLDDEDRSAPTGVS